MALWLGAVLLGTGLAGLFGRLPGVEPKPYIIRFTEDRPNPLYRRVCYTVAWSEAIAFALLNIAGLATAMVTGHVAVAPAVRGRLLPDRHRGLDPRRTRPVCRESSVRPRVKGTSGAISTGPVWAVAIAQPILWVLWKVLPHSRPADAFKLAIFVGVLAYVGNLARRGLCPEPVRLFLASSPSRTRHASTPGP